MKKELTKSFCSYLQKARNSFIVLFLVFNLTFFIPAAFAQDGLTAQVFNVRGQNNAPVLPEGAVPIYVTQVDNIDFQWGGGQVLNSGQTEDVIIRFTGDFTPVTTGTTYLTAPADDGVKLYLDGVQYIFDWYDKGGGGSTADVETIEGVSMAFEMWYYENGGGAAVSLLWFTENGWQVIPASAFLEPVVPEPEPVVPEPEPVVPEPEPVVPEPEPVVVQPEPVVVQPEPVVVQPVTPEPAPPVYFEPPAPVVEEPVTPEPEEVVEEPAPIEPEEPVPPVTDPVEPEQEPTQPVKEEIVEIEKEPVVEETVEETVTLENGVVLTAEQAVAIALLEDPAALLQEIFTDPAAAFAALSQVGADMSPEVREESEKVVLSAIIASGIATQAAATAAAGATYRRKP